MKRHITIEKVDALAVNLNNSHEFVLYIHDEHDYRFSSIEYRHLIIEKLLSVHSEHFKTSMAVFFIDEKDLSNYTTL